MNRNSFFSLLVFSTAAAIAVTQLSVSPDSAYCAETRTGVEKPAASERNAGAEKQPAKDESGRILSRAMQLMNEKKFSEANALLKSAIQADPSNALFWAAYDSCVRSEMLVMEAPGGSNSSVSDSADADKDPRDSGAISGSGKMPAADKPEPGKTPFAAATSEAGLKKSNPNESDASVSILEADFSGGNAAGDLACILNQAFMFIKSDSTSYLMLNLKEKNGNITLSFTIGKNYPKKITLDLSHRLVKRDRFLASAPVVISVNDSRVTYEDLKLGNRLDTSSFDITNFCKNGGNIITITVEKSKFPYLLKTAKLVQRFKE